MCWAGVVNLVMDCSPPLLIFMVFVLSYLNLDDAVFALFSFFFQVFFVFPFGMIPLPLVRCSSPATWYARQGSFFSLKIKHKYNSMYYNYI